MNSKSALLALALPLALLLVLPLALLLAACSAPPEAPSSADLDGADFAGTWRATLASPGGDLPFTLRIEQAADGLGAVIENGAEEVPVRNVRIEGRQILLTFDVYDSRIRAELDPDGQTLTGDWEKTAPEGGLSRLAFAASRGQAGRRFLAPAGDGEGAGAPASTAPTSTAPASIAGVWAVELTDESGHEPAQGEFTQTGTEVTGTFLTPTGDYRYLAGSYDQGLLRLSTFDGAHAFLFTARAGEDGTLAGDFWSRDGYHATWTARRAEEGEVILPDAWSLVGLTNDDGRFTFNFPDLDGGVLASDDPRFVGKVLLVNLFGSWCPNCNDEAPLLAAWYRRYRERGLEIVGLAYELTGDAERDRVFVRRYGERHGIEFPLLLAGLSDKGAAAETVPDLSAVIAFPTSIFIGRDGRVAKIYSGFAGPGTGAHHERLVAELEGVLEGLLGEPAP